MATQFALSVVAPDRSVVEGENVTSIIAPGTEGYFGVMAGHVPLIATLKPGLLEYVDASNNRHYVYIGGGFLEVGRDQVTVLADEAQRARDIDMSRAESALEDARRVLREGDGEQSDESAVLEVERAMHRLRAARRGAGASS